MTSQNSSIKEIRSVLNQEARAMAEVARGIDANFAKAINWLFACRGKVVLTGVGKSGIVAQKIAATFSSTGTPAVFLDPGEALHGGLGMVQKSDLVLAIGKSGESDELNMVLPVLRKNGVRVIALTSNTHSTLAKGSNLVLEMPLNGEACPLNLAPTTSTTVAMAIGDALAVALMKRRNFKSEHFAKNHPSGRLGRRLNLLVSDVMRSGKDNPTVKVNANMAELLSVITRKGAGAASIIDHRGRLVGLVTDYDLRRAVEKGGDLLKRSIASVMNPKPITIGPNELVAEAIDLMEDRRTPFNVLPVVDKNSRSVGLIQIHDLRARGI